MHEVFLDLLKIGKCMGIGIASQCQTSHARSKTGSNKSASVFALTPVAEKDGGSEA